MEISLKMQHFELLKEYCKLDINPSALPDKGNRVSVVGDKEYFENLLDEVSDILTDKGMDENFEPNELGLQIEEIIDVLSSAVYD